MATMSLSDTDQDPTTLSYEDKLYQVFIGCDSSGTGLLDRDAMLTLCERLLLEDEQTSFVLDHLVGDDQLVQVHFSHFKEAFLNLLTQSQSQCHTQPTNSNLTLSTSPTPPCPMSVSMSSSVISSSPSMSTIGSSADTKAHLDELADAKAKLRRNEQELEEKSEIVAELRETLEQSRISNCKLRQEYIELVQEARSAKALRDEIDVLNERVRRVDRLESECHRYRDKINELEFLKSRTEELREDNRILTEYKSMLEDQLEHAQRRADKCPELEGQLLQLRAYSSEIKLQNDHDKDKIDHLMSEVSQLRVEKKATLDELVAATTELEHVRCQLGTLEAGLSSSDDSSGSNRDNLFGQLNSDATKRVLKLELENQKLQSLVDNLKNSSCSNIKQYSIDCVSNGLDKDEQYLNNISPEISLQETDSGHVSLDPRQEKMERDNERLAQMIERLKESDLKVDQVTKLNQKLEQQIKELKARIDGDVVKSEASEKMISKLTTDCQRLQRQVDKLTKRLKELEQDASELGSENSKLEQSVQSLRVSMKRLDELEQEMTTLEGENHRLELERRSAVNETARLKVALETKDKTLDDQAAKLSTIELEVRELRKDHESFMSMSTNNGYNSVGHTLVNDVPPQRPKNGLIYPQATFNNTSNRSNGTANSSTTTPAHHGHQQPTTTIENKIAINLITSPTNQQHHNNGHYHSNQLGSEMRPSTLENGHVDRQVNYVNGTPNFVRGSYRSSSVNFGSLARRSQVATGIGLRMSNNGHGHAMAHVAVANGTRYAVHGHHGHYHHVHQVHHHVHVAAVSGHVVGNGNGNGQRSASSSLNSDNSTPTHEDDLSDDQDSVVSPVNRRLAVEASPNSPPSVAGTPNSGQPSS